MLLTTLALPPPARTVIPDAAFPFVVVTTRLTEKPSTTTSEDPILMAATPGAVPFTVDSLAAAKLRPPTGTPARAPFNTNPAWPAGIVTDSLYVAAATFTVSPGDEPVTA